MDGWPTWWVRINIVSDANEFVGGHAELSKPLPGLE